MTVLVFKDKATWETVAKEICVTPQIEDGGSPVWLWYDPESETNIVSPLIGADGRYAMCHSFDEVTRDWLGAYCAGIAGVEVLDALPADWQCPDELLN